MTAVHTCTLVEPSAMNSAASRQLADAADAGDGKPDVGVGSDLLHKVERGD